MPDLVDCADHGNRRLVQVTVPTSGKDNSIVESKGQLACGCSSTSTTRTPDEAQGVEFAAVVHNSNAIRLDLEIAPCGLPVIESVSGEFNYKVTDSIRHVGSP